MRGFRRGFRRVPFDEFSEFPEASAGSVRVPSGSAYEKTRFRRVLFDEFSEFPEASAGSVRVPSGSAYEKQVSVGFCLMSSANSPKLPRVPSGFSRVPHMKNEVPSGSV